MKIKPLGDRILVKRDVAETKTASGLYLPESATEKPQTAKVVNVGPGKVDEHSGKRVAMQIKKGDTVLLSKWGGTEVKIDDVEYLILSEEDVLGVVE